VPVEAPLADAPVALAPGTVVPWDAAVEVVWLLLPQPAGTAIASSAPTTAPARPNGVRPGELMENLPPGELIGSTGWWRAHAPVAPAA
jgi:hypothetical protein